MKNVRFFFRKPLPEYHSIEELFGNIRTALPSSISHDEYRLSLPNSGFKSLIKNTLDASKNQSEINHITGDVHYIALLMNQNKTILTIHDISSIRRKNPIKNFILKLFWFILPAKKVKYITVISEFTKKELLNYINIPAKNIKVIHNCIPDSFHFVEQKFNAHKPRILQVGTAWNKNLENVTKAIEKINSTFVIIGQLSDTQKQMLENSGLNYENHHNLSFDEVRQLYVGCDMVIFASKYEGFGLPIVEANATGRPVVTSNISAMPEIAGDAALLVSPDNVSQISAAINRIIVDVQLRKKLIANGLENVKRFLPKTIAAKYADLYETIMHKKA